MEAMMDARLDNAQSQSQTQTQTPFHIQFPALTLSPNAPYVFASSSARIVSCDSLLLSVQHVSTSVCVCVCVSVVVL